MKDIQTLEHLINKNPLDYILWNDLGIEYKNSGRYEDALNSYLKGIHVVFQNIYLHLKNSKDNVYLGFDTLGEKANHTFWLDRTIDCITGFAKIDGIKNIKFPTGQSVSDLSNESVYGCLLYYDKDDVRFIFPNFIHTFADCLTWNNIYATYINNIAVAYAELGIYEKAKEFFKESIAFTPKGSNYSNPIIGLKEIEGK